MHRRLQKNIEAAYVAVLSTLLSIYFFSSNLKIQLGPVDDHEIVKFLGPDQRLWIWQIPSVLLKDTEVGSYGDYARFRPTYYFFRLIETSAFGVDASDWFLARIFMVALTCIFLTLGLLRLLDLKNHILGLVLSSSFLLSVLSLTAWEDIVSRLGPSEIYLMLGISIFFYLSTRLILDPFVKKSWILLCVTYVLTLGTKENGILLSLPFLVLGITTFITSGKRLFVAISFGVSVLFSILISAGWIMGMESPGGDTYGNIRTIDTAKYQILQSLVYLRHNREFGFAVFAVLLYFFVSLGLRKKWHKSFWYLIGLQGSLHYMVIGEKIFYNADFGILRYAIVTQTLKVMLVAISVILIMNTMSLFKFRGNLPGLSVGIVFGLLLLQVTIPTAQATASNFRLVAENKRIGTEEFQEWIMKINVDLASTKYDSIVIQVNNVWDYEPAFATSQYLEFYGGGSPKFLNITSFPVAPGLETELLKQLNDYSKSGNASWKVEPDNLLEPKQNVYCITFNGAPKDSKICDN